MLRPLFVIAWMALTGCDDTVFSNGHGGGGGADGGSADGGGADGGADGGSTLSDQSWCAVQQVLQADCVACHGAAYPSGGLDLVTDPHAAMVGVPSALYSGLTLVVPGSPDESFLLAKVDGTQATDQGGAMPAPDGLSDERVEAVRAWIAEGAPSDCNPTGDGGSTDGGSTDGGSTEGYHPAGYADPAVHGLEAKLHVQTCTDCHGADLTGGKGLSCDSCHPTDWRTNCTYCHGGDEDSTGAPPVSIDGVADDAAFGAHPRHVQENTHAAFACEQCHLNPTDVLSEGHLFDSTPGVSEVDLSAGLAPLGSWSTSAKSCSDVYCHGNGQTEAGTVVAVDDAPLSCTSCHSGLDSGPAGWELMSERHAAHISRGASCGDCHSDTTSDGASILTPALHVNGEKNLGFATSDMVWNKARTCTGTCHGTNHLRRPWEH